MTPLARVTDDCRDGLDCDEPLAARIRLFLDARGFATLRKVAVGVQCSTVTLRGTVGSFYERQLAIECVKRVAGVRQIVDQIIVREAMEPSPASLAVEAEVFS